MGLLDFIYPKRCVVCKSGGEYLCGNCFSYLSFDTKSLCLVCKKPSFNGLTHPNCCSKYTIDGCFSALSYNKTAKRLVYNFKYKPYLKDLKTVLTDLFYESLIQNENFNRELKIALPAGGQVFVPVPLFKGKLRKRGYNQAEVLSFELAKRFNLKFLDILEKGKNTLSQVNLTEKQRRENIKGAFLMKKGFVGLLENKNIFLVDDVLTTGSTLLEAANVLKRSGAKRVIGLTLTRD